MNVLELANRLKKISVRPEYYIPQTIEIPENLLLYDSSWGGLERIIKDLMKQFNIGNECCLEFGVEFGYSTVAFSNYFKKVIGVDTFKGDPHAGVYDDHYLKTSSSLSPYPNIKLIQADYRDYIRSNNGFYDLIHVDIIHDYKHTFECGIWSAEHSTCTIFHDTTSFREVKRAVADIALHTGKKFYNYHKYYGLGILV